MHASEVLSGRIDRGYGDHLPKGTTISLRRSKLNLVTHDKCKENGLQFDRSQRCTIESPIDVSLDFGEVGGGN